MRKLFIALLFIGSVLNGQTYTPPTGNLFIQDSMKVGTSANSIWSDSITAGSIIHWINGASYTMDGGTDSIIGGDYYVATDGDDATGDGTIGNPWLSWDAANDSLSPGDTLYIRGGTYTANDFNGATQYWQYRFTGIHGTQANPIYIMKYPGETPVWSVTGGISTSIASTAVLIDDCDWLHFIGLDLGPTPMVNGYGVIYGYDIINSSNITMRECTVLQLSGAGFTIGNELWSRISNTEVSDSVRFLNCDAFGIEDPYSPTAYGGSDGFNISHNTNATPARNRWAPNVVFGGCRSAFNSDDGFDFFRCDSGLITVDSSLSAYNGYHMADTSNTGDGQGFKMGPNDTEVQKYDYAQFIVRRTVTFDNRTHGFDQNTSVSYHSSGRTFYNNLALNDDNTSYMFYDISASQTNPTPVLTNNISLGAQNIILWYSSGSDFTTDTYNTWNGSVTVNAADFTSLVLDVRSSRDANGNIVWGTFGQLVSGSDLIDAGTDVSLSYEGTGPDMGPFESDY